MRGSLQADHDPPGPADHDRLGRSAAISVESPPRIPRSSVSWSKPRCDPQNVSSANSTIRVLLIEDNPGDARLIREMLRDAGGGEQDVQLSHADRLSSGLDQLARIGADVVLLDLSLPDSH